MNWGILGIEPTSDKKVITQAYRKALASVNPEDKPEEFKALRAAYEEALELAKHAESVSDDEQPATPVDAWIKAVSDAYNHFPSRNSVDVWRSLLRDDVCVALDTRPAAEEALLRFLMQDYRLSGDVWRVIDQEFSWVERAAELKESYPHDFVDYVIVNGTTYGEFLPYNLFDPGQNAVDCDEYITLFTEARRSDPAEVKPIIDRMAALSETHPYGQVLKFSIEAKEGDEQARASMVELTQAFLSHEYIVSTAVGTLMELEDFEQGERICRAYLELDVSVNISFNLARCLAGQGEYAKGVEVLNEIMARVGGDDVALNTLNDLRREWDEPLIEEYTQRLNDDPDDMDARFELSWCYLQTDRVDESWELAQPLNPAEMDPFKYYNLVSQIHFAANRYEEGLAANDKVIEVIRSYGEGADETERKRVARMVEKLMLRASILQLTGEGEQAAQGFEEALAIDPDSPNNLNRIARFYLVTHDYRRAYEHALHLTKVLPNAYHGYLTLAYAAFGLHDDQQAFEAVNRAIDEDGSDLSEYALKLQILIRNGAFEEAHAIIDFLAEHGVDKAAGVLFASGQLVEYEEKDNQRAAEIYERVALQIEADEYTYDPASVFMRWAITTGQQLDMSEDANLCAVLDILERGLKKDEAHLGCLDYKAWILQKLGRNHDALDVLLAMEKDPRHDGDVEKQLADLYRKDMRHSADKALSYYRLLLQAEPENEVFLFYAGICAIRLGLYEEAEGYFLREEKVEPDNVDPHRGLYSVYMAQGKYHDAMWHVDRCLQICETEAKSTKDFLRDRIKTLRRMGLPSDAVATAYKLADYDLRLASQLIFDIYTQFGDFDAAKLHVKDKKMNPRWPTLETNVSYMLFLVPFLQKRFAKAKWVYFDQQWNMSESDRLEGQILLDSLNGKYGKEIEKWSERLKGLDAGDPDEASHVYMNLAEAYWHSGDMDQARAYASDGLAACDAALAEFSTYRPLFLTRKACVLAILGRFDEAEECLSQARSLPLCSHCVCCSCKDADLFEAVILSLKGLDAQSVSKCDEYLAKWPDETDFMVQRCYSEKRV